MVESKNKKKRGLQEVSHFFLSQHHGQHHQKFNDESSSYTAANSSRKLIAESAETALGCIILDRHKIVCFINPKARQLLNLKTQKFVGQLFNYFIRENETVRISIVSRNGKWGVGKMHMGKTIWQDESAYLIAIEDITGSLRTTEGKICFSDLG